MMTRSTTVVLGFAALFSASLGGCSVYDADDLGTGGSTTAPVTGGSGGALTSTGGQDAGSGGATTGGATGAGGDVSGTGGSIIVPVPGWPDAPTSGAAVWTRVRNLCPFPIWIHAAGSTGTLTPDNAQLATGDIIDYATPAEWSAARVTAYRDGPGQGEVEKAEMTIGNGVLNYNVTYVDWVGLPLEIVGVGAGCNDADHVTGCYAPSATLNDGCPHDFLRDNGRCLSPRSYCLNPANQGTTYCHSLDSTIDACAHCPDATTPEVFACSGPYAEEPRLCAALNRGISQTPDDNDPSHFYQNPPYNDYAKWVHEACPDIYAFSYDDWQSHGGFRACSGNELRITFCPAG